MMAFSLLLIIFIETKNNNKFGSVGKQLSSTHLGFPGWSNNKIEVRH